MKTLSVGFAMIFSVVVGPPEEGSLKVADVLTIASPGKGFQWRHVTDVEEKGMKARYYRCTSEKSKAQILLTVEGRFPETDKHKIAAFAAYVNTTATKLVRDGYQIDKKAMEIPKLDPPIPARLAFSMTGKQNESEIHIRNVTFFGKNIYSLTVWANDAKDAERLIDVAKTFKELAK